MLTRRRFLATTAFTLAAVRLHAQGQNKIRVALAVPNEATGPRVPTNCEGLSCEVQQTCRPEFLFRTEQHLIREFKALNRHFAAWWQHQRIRLLETETMPLPTQSIVKPVR